MNFYQIKEKMNFNKAKSILVLLFICVLQFESKGQDTISKSDYVRNDDMLYYNDKLYTGVVIEKSKNGQVINEEHYKNGLANGLWKEWYASGEKKFEGSFLQGKNSGTWTQWYRDGTIQRKLTFKDGKIIEE